MSVSNKDAEILKILKNSCAILVKYCAINSLTTSEKMNTIKQLLLKSSCIFAHGGTFFFCPAAANALWMCSEVHCVGWK